MRGDDGKVDEMATIGESLRDIMYAGIGAVANDCAKRAAGNIVGGTVNCLAFSICI